MLFVVSARYYAIERQSALGREAQPLIEALLRGDVDGDGLPDQRAARSIQLAVITADLGATGAPPHTGCTETGDDALLRATSPHRAEPLSPVQRVEDTSDVARVAADVDALLAIGNDDCVAVQSLEAALAALSPVAATAWTADGYEPPIFVGGGGHGDVANAALIRDGSVLVVVFLAAHDDMSLADQELFAFPSDRYDGELGERALRHPMALHPIERYVSGLVQLRRDPRRLVVASIVGTPPIDDPASVDLTELLASPDMQIRWGADDRPVPACFPGSIANAGWPARRHVELARELSARGASTLVSSSCDATYESMRVAITRAVGSALEPSCSEGP